MNLQDELNLARNIQQGCKIEVATFIAMAVRFAIEHGVQDQIGTFGLQYIERACHTPVIEGNMTFERAKQR